MNKEKRKRYILIMKKNITTIFEKYWRGIISIAVTVVIWEFSVRFGFLSKMFISSPGDVFLSGAGLVESVEFWNNLMISLAALFCGFLLAIFIGVPSGIFIGFNKKIYEYLQFHLHALNALPIVALVPIIVLGFGIGLASKIAVVFLMALTPILFNVSDGAKNVNRSFVLMAKSFGVRGAQILKFIVFPDSLPFIFSGVRVAVGRAIIGLIISEVFGYGKGIGYLVYYYGGSFQTGKFIFLIIILLILNILILQIIKIIQQKIMPWRFSS